MNKCHVCEENEADYVCQRCGEPVCEACCVPNTYMNPVEETRCTICHEGMEAVRHMDYDQECERVEALAAKREARRKKMRENYFKPENVEKKRLRKIERRRLKAEHEREMMKRVVEVVSSMFSGMF